MKRIALFFTLLIGVCAQNFAQDDMYFVPKKKSKSKTTQVTTQNKSTTESYTNPNAEYYTGKLRDVDEYNRRKGYYTEPLDGDTLRKNDLAVDENGNYILGSAQNNGKKKSIRSYEYDDNYYVDDYDYTIRLSRFHGVVTPYVALYDPFYYDPFYYTSWYYDPWYRGTYWGWYGGWHSPWYYDPWYNGYYGWGGHHHWHPHPAHGGSVTYRGYNGGRGSGPTGASTRGGSYATRGGSTSRMAGNSLQNRTTTSRGYSIDRSTGTQSRSSYSGSTRGYNVPQRSAGSSRGISSSSSRSTVTNTSRPTGRATTTTVTTPRTYSGSSSSSSRSYSGSSRGSSGGGFSGGGSRGGGYSAGGSSRGGRR